MIGFGSPILFYWIFLYPLTCLFYMIFNRKDNGQINIRIKMGYFMNGYKPEHYYWYLPFSFYFKIKFNFIKREFFIMYRKIIFIFISIIPYISDEQKAIYLIFFSLTSLYLTLFIIPFQLRELNILEAYSNLTAFVTIFAGSLYILDINDYVKVGIFVFLVVVNSMFVVKWISSVFEIIITTYHDKLVKICGSFIYNAAKKILNRTSYKSETRVSKTKRKLKFEN